MLLPQTWSEAGKFCIHETESCNLVNTFWCKFNKGDENFSSTGTTDPIVHHGRTWRAGMIHRPSPWSNTEGDISNNHPLYDSAHFGFLNKCQVYLRLCERRHFNPKRAGGWNPPPLDIFCYISAGCYFFALKHHDFFPSSLALDLRPFV